MGEVTNQEIQIDVIEIKAMLGGRLTTLEGVASRHEDAIDGIESSMNGNGQPGILTQLEVLAAFMHDTKKLHWFIGLAIVGDVIVRILDSI